jgi:acetyl-CoA acetyltransferase family protein
MENGTVTAGNSSPLNDGASLTLLASEAACERFALKQRARVVDYAVVGLDPCLMGMGPVPAIRKLLQKNNLSVADIDLFELNEAFAAVVLRFMQALNVDHSIMNVNGGAIAMGHPLGATGAMILGTMVDELERANKQTALVTLCIGGGMGIATIIERV